MSDFTSVDIYQDYLDSGGELDRETFHKLCIEFNTKVMEEIIKKGRVFNMGERLSTLEVTKVKRNFNKKKVNWKKSNELKQKIIDEGGTPKSKENPDGEHWLVYYTDDWYCKFHWTKKNCVVKNKTAYRFTATRGDKGNKTMLKKHLRADNLAHMKYRVLE